MKSRFCDVKITSKLKFSKVEKHHRDKDWGRLRRITNKDLEQFPLHFLKTSTITEVASGTPLSHKSGQDAIFPDNL